MHSSQYYGYITTDATIIIIGTDKEKVEEVFRSKNLNQTQIDKNLLARFNYSATTGSQSIILTGFEPTEAHTKAIKREVADLESKPEETRFRVYHTKIQRLLSSHLSKHSAYTAAGSIA
jgi:hypothetical protein